MSIVEFKVDSMADLEAQLLELGAELGVKALAQAMRKAFMPVLEAAKANVPIWSGQLRDNIRLTVKKPSEGDAVVVVGLYIGNEQSYDTGELPPDRRWHFIEFGTAHMAAHPYLRPALDANAGAVLDALKSELETSIARALRKKARAG